MAKIRYTQTLTHQIELKPETCTQVDVDWRTTEIMVIQIETKTHTYTQHKRTYTQQNPYNQRLTKNSSDQISTRSLFCNRHIFFNASVLCFKRLLHADGIERKRCNNGCWWVSQTNISILCKPRFAIRRDCIAHIADVSLLEDENAIVIDTASYEDLEFFFTWMNDEIAYSIVQNSPISDGAAMVHGQIPSVVLFSLWLHISSTTFDFALQDMRKPCPHLPVSV